ncbi:ribosome-binding protein 1-like [Toxorhynchites rutilus septentrionalis]|uniref:ribosome-binding protein 1-like n=1 Tax=Toxorhynchites rutilus septentrionalis TaxID=329112 RepID=UPI00247A36E4|nr:ribosome-binding protein 1-like [Toxorhynchites rutilus septentrionalis]
MSSQANVRQTRPRTRAQQANAAPNTGIDDDQISNQSSEDSFIPSMVDSDRGELHDCAGCNRPNSSERYMVQSQKCIRWYHFSCANVNTTTVRSSCFVCVSCMRSEISGVLEPAASRISGITSTSSTRAARVARELQRLEEEKKLLEELSRERIEKERALNEREHREKMEREKQFIARKHELLNRQDNEDARSVRSVRSSQRDAMRTENWVRQTETVASEVIIPTSTSMSANHPEDTCLGNPQGLHPSSTPLKINTPVVHTSAGGDRTGLEENSIPRNMKSEIVAENAEKSLENSDKVNADKVSQTVLPIVDLQPYADLLRVEEVVPTGAYPKVNRLGPQCYKRWSVQTSDLPKQALLQQQQTETEHRDVEALLARHRFDIDTRRKRESELMDQIKNLQSQHAEELKLVRESETGLRSRLKDSEREQAELKTQIKNLQLQFVEGSEWMRNSEADLRAQLDKRNRECETLQLQVGKLEREINGLRVTEQQFQLQIEAILRREQEAIRRQSEAEKEYGDLLEEVQQIINRYEGRSDDCSFSAPLPPPPASWFDSTKENNDELNPPFSPPLISADDGLPGVFGEGISSMPPAPIPPTPIYPLQFSQGLVPSYTSGHSGPTMHQLAARQVVIKELPIFSGDPIDWPFFISSYQNSTEACGYSNAENLLRLQRSLRGSAKDSVSSFLLHPSTVPQILSTLQQLYGRPEQIVNNMIAKVRATPAPKPDRLETLVSFGLVVQNLCGHLKVVGLQNHLANPILLQELVDKLPATVKFSWALYQEQVPVVDLNVFSAYMAKIS